MQFPHPRVQDIKMGHRLVVLPDWQGLGIGGALDDWLGEWLHTRGYRYRNVVAHPAMIAHYSRSPRWRLCHSGITGPGAATARTRNVLSLRVHQRQQSAQRNTCSFEYVPRRVAAGASA